MALRARPARRTRPRGGDLRRRPRAKGLSVSVGAESVPSLRWGAPTWPPIPPHRPSRPREAVARLDPPPPVAPPRSRGAPPPPHPPGGPAEPRPPPLPPPLPPPHRPFFCQPPD